MEREMEEPGWTWGFLEGVAADRPRWRSLVALSANLREDDEVSTSLNRASTILITK